MNTSFTLRRLNVVVGSEILRYEDNKVAEMKGDTRIFQTVIDGVLRSTVAAVRHRHS